MSKKGLLYGSFSFLLLATCCGISRAQSFSIHQYTTADGLPDNVVFSVTQDSNGYLWVATSNGLSRFDGRNFLNYGLHENLPSLYVNGVYEDRLKNSWVLTRNGLALINEDSCYNYPLSNDGKGDYMLMMAENSAGELLALTNRNTYVFRNKNWQQTFLVPGYEKNSLSGMVYCKEGCVMTYNGNILLLRKNNNDIKTLASFNESYPFITGLKTKDNRCYVATHKGFFYLENEKLIPLFEDTLKTRYVYSFFADSKNRFWFSTKEDGILLVTPGKDKITYQKIPVSFNLVFNFFEDREKNIWVSSVGGLLKITDVPYQTYTLASSAGLGQLRNIIALPNNGLLVSGASGKIVLLRQDTSAEQSITFKIRKVFSLSPNDFIDYYSSDEKNQLWFCTRQSHLYRLDNDILEDYTHLLKNKQDIRSVFYDKQEQRLYVSADSVLFSGNQNYLDTLKETGTNKYIPLPAHICRMPDGKILVNTLEDGLIKINADGSFTSVNKMTALPRKFTGLIFRSDRRNNIWLSFEGSGILKYQFDVEKDLRQLLMINRQSGLPDDAVNDFTFDKSGNIWAITKSNIIILQQNATRLWEKHSFETSSDIKQPDLFFSKMVTDAGGNTWITGRDRLLRFSPKNNILFNPAPEVVIEKVLLFGRPVNWSTLSDSVTNYFQLPVNPVLQHQNNSLSIFFNGIKFNRDNILEYSYQLLPGDTGWSTPGINNSISFYQLPPGAYHFFVKARIRGNDWGIPKQFSFTIKKAWWETWWLKVLIVLLASGMLLFIFRYRLKQVARKNDLQNQLRDLEMKAFKAQMNPHFIHNALNSIQSLIVNKKSEEASNYVTKFARLLRQVLENADKNVITLDKELYSLQLYFDLEQLRLDVKIKYEVVTDSTIAAAEIKLPPLILQPFVENSLWHGLSRKEGDRKLTMRISEENDWVICTITDNGIGRQKAAESYDAFPEGHFSKAVTITEKRLLDFNRTSLPSPITYTDLYEQEQPSGTTVTIRIRKQY